MTNTSNHQEFDRFINQAYIERQTKDKVLLKFSAFGLFVLPFILYLYIANDNIFDNWVFLISVCLSMVSSICLTISILHYHYRYKIILKINFLNNGIGTLTQFGEKTLKDIEIINTDFKNNSLFPIFFKNNTTLQGILLKSQGIEYLIYYNPEYKEYLLEKLQEYQ